MEIGFSIFDWKIIRMKIECFISDIKKIVPVPYRVCFVGNRHWLLFHLN